jgi:flagellar hook-associated protein 1 FlgK
MSSEPSGVFKTLISTIDQYGNVQPEPVASGDVTAANISISFEWTQGGPGYFIFSKNENAPNFAQQIITALTTDTRSFGTNSDAFEGTFEDFIANYASNLGSEIRFQEGRFQAVAMVANDFLDRRDSISGVNRDEETANMLIFQKSYNAAARMMTTLDEMVEVLIFRMGRVGL